MNTFTADDVADQSGRTILVTGANTGIGFATAKVLAANGARVLLGCRSEERATAAMSRIAADVVDADLGFVALDQGDLDSIRSAADTIIDAEERLDVVVNNAGIMIPPREMTSDGFESQFGINHLGTFALTSLLLPKLAETTGSRVVVTSSIAHRGGTIHFGDIDASGKYRAQERYQQSKLANLLFMYELDRRLRAHDSGTIAVACHPGIAATELLRNVPKVVASIAAPVLSVFFNSAEHGAWPTLMAATSADMVGGDYVGPSRRGETAGPARKVASTGRARDPQLAQLLWDLSVEMTGVDPDI